MSESADAQSFSPAAASQDILGFVTKAQEAATNKKLSTDQTRTSLLTEYSKQSDETKKRIAAIIIDQIGESIKTNSGQKITQNLKIARALDLANQAYSTKEQRQQAMEQFQSLELLYPATEEIESDSLMPPLQVPKTRSHRGILSRRTLLSGVIGLGAAALGTALLSQSSAGSSTETEPASQTTETSEPTPKPATATTATTSTSVPTATEAPTLTPIADPTVEVKPDKPINLAEKVLESLISEALERRRQRAREDPEYYHRVDKELNEGRINFLLFGYGEEHGETYADKGGSISMVSYDLRTGQIASISLSRDIRAPELEKLLPETEKRAMPIRHVYKQGGFDLMRTVAEDATGLSADFQIVMKDTVIKDLMEQISGPITINVDKAHQTNSYRLGGVEYPPTFISEGVQTMDAMQAMTFILAEDEHPDGRKDERSYRKNILMRAIKDKISFKVKKETSQNLTLPFKIDSFLKSNVKDGDIELDFEPNLVSRGLTGLGTALWEYVKNLGKVEIVTPDDNVSVEAAIHDPFWGDGSVRRTHNIRNGDGNPKEKDNPKVIEEAKRGYMPDWMLLPDGGNPYASDLITEYWRAVRQLIKNKLRPV